MVSDTCVKLIGPHQSSTQGTKKQDASELQSEMLQAEKPRTKRKKKRNFEIDHLRSSSPQITPLSSAR